MFDYSKLIAHDKDKTKSFEQLCYQLVDEEYRDEINKGAVLTSFNDSGGGSGVEFYLERPNGTVLGWQCKSFRKIENAQKNQIRESLQKSYKQFGENLIEWYLCTPEDLTPSKAGKVGGLEWYKEKLAEEKLHGELVLPHGHKLSLKNWGYSRINNLLRKHPSIDRYFFGSCRFEWDWFEEQYKTNLSLVRSKYNPCLHIDVNVEEEVFKAVGSWESATESMEFYGNNLSISQFVQEYEESINNLRKARVNAEYRKIKIEMLKLARKHRDIAKEGRLLYEKSLSHLTDGDIEKLQNYNSELEKYDTQLRDCYGDYKQLVISPLMDILEPEGKPRGKLREQDKELRRLLWGPYFVINNYAKGFLSVLAIPYDFANTTVLRILGNPGIGKTYSSFNIYEVLIRNHLPAIFLYGNHFGSELPIEVQIQEQLEIPNIYNLQDFLSALEIAAKINKTKIPIIIDGLHEARYWQNIWKEKLCKFAYIVEKYPHLALITTCRTSYERALYYNEELENERSLTLYGFCDPDEAMRKYFDFYKIHLTDCSSKAKDFFRNPLFLSIFCGIHGDENRKGKKEVVFKSENLMSLFDEYLQKSDEVIKEKLRPPHLRSHGEIVKNKLKQIALGLWRNNSNCVPINDYLGNGKTFNDEELEVFLGENLLIDKDFQECEILKFTYDLLGGYVIAIALLEQHKSDLIAFLKSQEFTKKILNKEHLLSDSILQCLSILTATKQNLFIFEHIDHPTSNSACLHTLFELDEIYLKNKSEKAKAFLIKEHKNGNHDLLWERINHRDILSATHPFNIDLWHEVLFEMPLPVRDAVWSSAVAQSPQANLKVEQLNDDWTGLNNQNGEILIRIGTYFTWFLSTTNRDIRNMATRGIILIFQNRLEEFLQVILKFLRVDDPYIIQRLCAISLGLIFRSNDTKSLRDLTDILYTWCYTENNLPIDILARDYCRLIFEYSNKKLKTNYDLSLADKPHKTTLDLSTIPLWEELKNRYGEVYGVWSSLIGLIADFGRYTVGSAVNNWMNIRLEEDTPPSESFLREKLIASLEPEQKKKWDELQDLKIQHLFSFPPVILFKDENDKTSKRNRVLEHKGKAKITRKTNEFVKNLSLSQKTLYEEFTNFNRDAYDMATKFDSQTAKNWIYQRVMELGYEESLHKNFDESVANYFYSETRDLAKIERIGKKYQWIALFELLARLSDNYRFKLDFLGEEQGKYISPWPLYIRDFDPTHLGRAISSVGKSSLPHIYLEYDEKGLIDSKLSDFKWIEDTECGIPNYKNFISRTDTNGVEWMMLEGMIAHNQYGEASPWRDSYHIINGYFLRQKHFKKMLDWAKKQNFMGRWMPESGHAPNLFIGEFFWTESYQQLYESQRENMGWKSNTKGNKKLPCEILVASDNFGLESIGADKLRHEFINNSRIVSKELFEGLDLEWNDAKKGFVNKEGVLIAFDPFQHGNYRSCLLIRKSAVVEFLQKSNFNIFWTVLGEKQIINHPSLVSNEISGVYYFDKDMKSVQGGYNSQIITRK